MMPWNLVHIVISWQIYNAENVLRYSLAKVSKFSVDWAILTTQVTFFHLLFHLCRPFRLCSRGKKQMWISLWTLIFNFSVLKEVEPFFLNKYFCFSFMEKWSWFTKKIFVFISPIVGIHILAQTKSIQTIYFARFTLFFCFFGRKHF